MQRLCNNSAWHHLLQKSDMIGGGTGTIILRGTG
jgi:hypothetical protein